MESQSFSAAGPTNLEAAVFDSFGILEHILSHCDTDTLLSAAVVNHRWKEAGRDDGLWKEALKKLWEGKKGVHLKDEPIFWRSLFTKEAVSEMSQYQIRAIFEHPFLSDKKKLLEKCGDKSELQRFLKVHMLDTMSDGSQRHRFFSEIYFGSYACSMVDSRREVISQAELCAECGYDMFFKIDEDEVDDEDRDGLLKYDEAENILLYHHSVCYFEENRKFRIQLIDAVHSYHPTDLKWGWLEIGHRMQVGPYPALTASRRKDWGWKLENSHVVLLFRDHQKQEGFDEAQ